jgi:hypothetical protein
MYILLIIFISYLFWVVPQYIMHRFAHFMIKKHYKNPITFGETEHHKYGKHYNYDTNSDPDLSWINVNKKFIAINIFIAAIIVFLIFSLWYSIIFFIFCLLFSNIDLYIHKKIHLGHEGFIVNISRHLHSIHHKTWKHNYSIFLGIPLDIIFLTFRSKRD